MTFLETEFKVLTLKDPDGGGDVTVFSLSRS